jgi:hypothetical protein
MVSYLKRAVLHSAEEWACSADMVAWVASRWSWEA